MPARTDSPADRFTWTSPDDVVVTLPKMGRIKSGTIRRLRKGTDVDFMYGLLEETLDEAELAKTDELSVDDVQALFAAWEKDAGATLPE